MSESAVRQLTFTRTPGKHCFYTTLASLLHHTTRINLRESWMCALCGSPCLTLIEEPTADGAAPTVYLNGVTIDDVQIARLLNLRIYREEEPDPEAAWAASRALIDSGQIQAVTVDTGLLPVATQGDQAGQIQHPLIIFGYDEQSAYVSDVDYQGSVPIADLMRARSGPLAGPGNGWLRLDLHGPIRPAPELLGLALSQPAHNPDAWSGGAALAAGLARWAATLPEPALATLVRSLHYQLLWSVVYPRRLLIECLQSLPPSENIVQASTLLAQAADQWVVLANLMVKALLYTRPATLLVPRLQERLLGLTELETRGWQLISA